MFKEKVRNSHSLGQEKREKNYFLMHLSITSILNFQKIGEDKKKVKENGPVLKG